jgi:hypothetical protein
MSGALLNALDTVVIANPLNSEIVFSVGFISIF